MQANIVLQVNDIKGETIYYKRTPLNWLEDDLNGKIKRVKLTTGALPQNTGDVVVYMWNYKLAELDFMINKIKLLELNGKGVDFMIPDSYYKYIEKATDKILL